MIKRLIFQNSKSTVKNYLPYFCVLSVSVCVFYAFNAYLSSDKIKRLSNYFTGGDSAVTFASIVFMLGFFVISFFATHNLYSYRSREFAVYLTLGVPVKTIFFITVFENLAVTLFALLVGIASGSVFFELFAAVIFSVFGVSYSFGLEFNFTAIAVCVLFFVLNGLFSTVANAFFESRKSPLELLRHSTRHSGKIIRKKILLPVLYICCILCACADLAFLFTAVKANFDANEKIFLLFLFLCVFFFVGFVLLAVLTVFCACTIGHFGKKYSPNVVFIKSKFSAEAGKLITMLTAASIMLTASFSLFTVGNVYTGIEENKLAQNYPFDIMLTVRQEAVDLEKNEGRSYYFDEAVNEIASRYKVQSLHTYNIFRTSEYGADSNTYKIFGNTEYEEITITYGAKDLFMTLSDYNALRRIIGEKEISLNKWECAVHSQNYAEFIKSTNVENIMVGESEYKLKYVLTGAFAQDCVEVRVNGEHGLIFVVPDEVCNTLEKYSLVTVINTRETVDTKPQIYFNDLKSTYYLYLTSIINGFEERIEYWQTRDGNIKISSGINLAEVYVAAQAKEIGRAAYVDYSFFFFYLGFIFAIASVVLPILYKLGKVNEDRYEYFVAERLGLTARERKRILFKECAIIFAVPVIFSVLASLCIFICIFKIYNGFVGDGMILRLFVFSQLFMSVVYIGLFSVTYFFLSKAVINSD